MTWTDKRSRIARLQRAQRRWAWEDRTRGYPPYGIRKPHRRAIRHHKQFKEGLFTLGVCIVLALVVTGQ
jgi:hypothetical protein